MRVCRSCESQLLSLVNIHYAVERKSQTEDFDDTTAGNLLDSDSPQMTSVQLRAPLVLTDTEKQDLNPDVPCEESPGTSDATPTGSGCSAGSTWTTPDTGESTSVYYDSPAVR